MGCCCRPPPAAAHQVCGLVLLVAPLLVQLTALKRHLALTLDQAVRQVLQGTGEQYMSQGHKPVLRPLQATRGHSPSPSHIHAASPQQHSAALQHTPSTQHTCSRFASAVRRCCSSCSCAAFLLVVSCWALRAASRSPRLLLRSSSCTFQAGWVGLTHGDG